MGSTTGPITREIRANQQLTEKELGIKQLPFRLSLHDKNALLKLLADDELTFQKFVDSCIQAYIRGDPHMMRCVAEWKMVAEIPSHVRARSLLSHRERAAILDEVERAEKEALLIDAEEREDDP